MDFHKKLREIRENKGISQKEAAAMIGVAKSTYSLYESGKRSPDVPTIKKIAAALGTTGDELLQTSSARCAAHTAGEAAVISRYRALDTHGREVVDAVLDMEYSRVLAQAQPQAAKNNIVKFPMTYFDVPVSAGTGEPLDYSTSTVIELGDLPPQDADFIVRVSGGSMEPTYHDGDLLFVSKDTDLAYGDIGIFCVDGSAYVKEYRREGLISHNRAYPALTFGEYADILCMGRVLGPAGAAGDSITVYRAARSASNRQAESVAMSKNRLEKIKNAPTVQNDNAL